MPATSIIKFEADIAKFQQKIKVAKGTIVKKIAIDLWTRITMRTPVDTGRARANWFITQGEPTQRIDEYKGAVQVPSPTPPMLSGVTGDESVFIINNLPYIEALENGHSKQAPNGMVKLAIQSTAAAIERANFLSDNP